MAATYVECKDREEAMAACAAGILWLGGSDGTWERLPERDSWYVESWYGKPRWEAHYFAVKVDDEE